MRRFEIKHLLVGAALLGLGACGGIGSAKSNLRSAVDAKKPSLDECYGQALGRDKAAAGSMTLKLTVKDGTGMVNKVEVVDAGFADGELQSCVEGALDGLTIASKPKANVEIEYVLRFSPRT
jgi:hypothetical protein